MSFAPVAVVVAVVVWRAANMSGKMLPGGMSCKHCAGALRSLLNVRMPLEGCCDVRLLKSRLWLEDDDQGRSDLGERLFLSISINVTSPPKLELSTPT